MKEYNTPIKYGLIGGLIMCVLAVLTYMFYAQLFSSFSMQMLYGLVALGIMIFIPIWAGVTFKRENNNDLSFAKAFVVCFIAFAIMQLIGGTISYVIPNFVDTEYPEKLHELVQNTTRETMEKFNAPEDQIDQKVEEIKLEQFKPTALTALQSFGKMLAFGAVLCALIALFVKRKPKNTIPTVDESPAP